MLLPLFFHSLPPISLSKFEIKCCFPPSSSSSSGRAERNLVPRAKMGLGGLETLHYCSCWAYWNQPLRMGTILQIYFRITLLFFSVSNMGILVFLLFPLGSERRKRDKRGGGRIEKCCFFPLVSVSHYCTKAWNSISIPRPRISLPLQARKKKLSWTRIFLEALLTLLDVERNISFPARVAPKKKSLFVNVSRGDGEGKDERCGERNVFPALKCLTQDATVRKKRTPMGPFQDPDHPSSSCTFRKFEWQACMPRFPPLLYWKITSSASKKPSRV